LKKDGSALLGSETVDCNNCWQKLFMTKIMRILLMKRSYKYLSVFHSTKGAKFLFQNLYWAKNNDNSVILKFHEKLWKACIKSYLDNHILPHYYQRTKTRRKVSRSWQGMRPTVPSNSLLLMNETIRCDLRFKWGL